MEKDPTYLRFQTEDGQRLGYLKLDTHCWRFTHREADGGWATVGPIYQTKAELLADATRYAEQFGFPI